MKVYLIEFTVPNGQAYYKIGFSRFPKERLYSLQLSIPFELSITCQAEFETIGPRVETALHVRFRERKLRGEWFALEPSEAAWIKELFGRVTGGENDRIAALVEIGGPVVTGSE